MHSTTNNILNGFNTSVCFNFDSLQLLTFSQKEASFTLNLLVHYNSSPRGRGYWKFNNNLLLDDEYFFKTKIAIANYRLNNTATETNPRTRWEALKCFLRGRTINYFCRKKKMLSMRQEALENLIKYEETNLLTTNDTQTSIDKISFYQNEVENLVQNRTKGSIVRSGVRWVENGEKNREYFLNLEKEAMIKKSSVN